MKKIFVVDGYSILFRTYYSIGEMSTSSNIPIGGVFGFVRAILTMLQRHEVKDVFIALDSGSKTFRSQMYQEYKANRAAAPEDLIPQFGILTEFLSSANIANQKIDGFEADDIIASVATKEQDSQVVIVSSDKDLMQLVDGRVTCLDFFKNQFYHASDVTKKFGIEPKHIVDYLALIGDSSDNIPGVKGCGPKTAVKLIEQFGNVENIIANISNIPNERTRNMVQQHQEMALLSKKLATLQHNIPLKESSYNVAEINFAQAKNFLEKYEMNSLHYLLEKVVSSNKKAEEGAPKQTSLF